MFRSIKSVLFSLFLVLSFASCDKEVSVENGDDNTGGSQSGTAVFTLSGAPLPCTTPLISGDYVVGTPLDVSNTVTLTVDVTTLGDYVISTGLINGIQFVGTGAFATTGIQTITMFGTGTPESPITGTYVPGTDGCSFSITPVTSIIVPVGPLYYEATIGGTFYRKEANGTNYTNTFGVDGTATDVTLSSAIAPVSVIPPAPANLTEFTVYKGILHSYNSVSNVTFKAFFSPGSIAYGADPTDGIEITWIDEAGNLWSTASGTAIQSGSTFTITNVEDEPGQTSYSVRVTATYNCNLYDDAGNTKTVTGGKFVGVFSKL